MAEPKERILTTCPRDCYDACGIVVIKKDGAITNVRGDPAHPVSRGSLCPKCAAGYNGAWRDPKSRLGTPLKRAGAKGAGSFEPVSWDVALEEIATRLKGIALTSGAGTILNTHYSGTFALLGYHFPMRFFNRLGAREVDPDSICNKAGHVALDYVYGTSQLGFDPRTARDAACILVWGANPSASAPHQHSQWLPESGAKVIVVDPVRTPTAAAADLHLQPFPGTDAALAFAIMHVLLRENLQDREFLERHALGWSELEPSVRDYTPERAEEATGVRVEMIVEAARLYGRGPSMLWLGQGFQRQRTGGNAVRTCAMLPALTGNLGKPGTGFLYLNGNTCRGVDEDYLTGAHLAHSKPDSISQMDLAACLEDPVRSRALLCWNINIAASNPQQTRLRTALAREDLFTVVVDLFPTDTADYADFVLPAASFLEFDDVVLSYFNLSVSTQVKATEPIGSSLPNSEIFRRLARAMGYTEPELFESDRQIIETVLLQTGVCEDFASLAAKGTAFISPEPVIQFEGLRFPTPSGKIEIASSRAEEDGQPRVPVALAEPRPPEGRLKLLSPAGRWLLNDSFANDPRVRKRLGETQVTLNPTDATERGLAEGDRVVLRNETGNLRCVVSISPAVPAGVALSQKGRWPKLEPGGTNVNVLNPGEKSDMGQSTAVHGIEVSVEPI
jgi:anaerobic selenocysteine-containing dehydrogenase